MIFVSWFHLRLKPIHLGGGAFDDSVFYQDSSQTQGPFSAEDLGS